ncbi:hypothetical protein D6764_00280 [Candidatus Woesearchaeota archaeon]|nr:MAG: hypothetical protein D6764_00280 [Candidatus Woesearchaeota archaeon]
MEVTAGKPVVVEKQVPAGFGNLWKSAGSSLENVLDSAAYSLYKASVPPVTRAVIGPAIYRLGSDSVVLPYLALINDDKGSSARIGVIPREDGLEIVSDYTANDPQIREAAEIVSDWLMKKYEWLLPEGYKVLTGPAQIP